MSAKGKTYIVGDRRGGHIKVWKSSSGSGWAGSYYYDTAPWWFPWYAKTRREAFIGAFKGGEALSETVEWSDRR
jgi:hypothetical protein